MQIRRYQVRGRSVPIPSVSTAKQQPQLFDYVKALITGLPNDLQPKKSLRYVTDMRFDGIGKYITRKGCDHYTVPVGESINTQITSTAGAGDAEFSKTTWIAQKITATTAGVLTRLDVNLKNSGSARGTVLVELHRDNSGVPGELISTSSVAQEAISSSYTYKISYSMQAPDIANSTNYWVVIRLQDSGVGTMYASSTTNSSNALITTNEGQSWESTAYSINVKAYTSTSGGVRGLTRVYRPNGIGYTFFAHGSNVYLVNDVDGSITSVDSSLASTVEQIRFGFVNDVLYYTDGGKPRKYDWSSSSEVSTAIKNASNLMDHAGLMFYFQPEDPTSFYYTNFGEYEKFTSTDFLYGDAPKKADHLVAMARLNGVLYLFTQRNKLMLLGQDNATFRVDEAYAQKGTYSQESVVFDENYVYFASDDGIYKFNGTSEKNIAENIIDDYTSLLSKKDIHLQLHNNRLYVWYRPNGTAQVNRCIVYNTLYDVVESIDENTFVGRSFARHDTTGQFIQASNRAGVLYFGELNTNRHSNLGMPLNAEVRTHYEHFGSPQRKKRITYWRPIIESTAGSYSMQCGFAGDYSDDVNYRDVNLQGMGFMYDDDDSKYDSSQYAAKVTGVDTSLNTFGEHYRWQRRYKHYAANEPFVFAGEELVVETQRLR